MAVRKSPDAFRTISEVAEILDIPAHVLRFWESRFTQIKPVKRGGGRRYYRPQDIDLLRGIRDLLYQDGFTIKGVQKVLRERGVKHVIELGHITPPETTGSPVSDANLSEAPAATPAPAPAAVSPTPQPEPVAPPAPAPDLRAFPQVDLPRTPTAQTEEDQFDLFAHAPQRSRRPFPPDPAKAQRTEALRSLYGKLSALREKMAADAP
ncbi:MAG: MerR family transcriptional regulator [Pseudomonadota bacterium]